MQRSRFFVLMLFFLVLACEGAVVPPAPVDVDPVGTPSAAPVVEVAKARVELERPIDVDDPNAELVVTPTKKPNDVVLWNGR